MIDLHYWPTPNGHKITIFLEEATIPYRVLPVDIGKGAQFEPEFLAIAPNNRMPAIVDHEPIDGGAPISVFESGAILLYLSDKAQKFQGAGLRQQVAVSEWLMWQMAGLGPMLGQANHFMHYAPEKIAYGINRYTKEANRLAGVMNTRLGKTRYLAGDDYTIADMAAYPWALVLDALGEKLEGMAALTRWMNELGERPAVQRGLAVGAELRKPLDDEAKKLLFGQAAR